MENTLANRSVTVIATDYVMSLEKLKEYGFDVDEDWIIKSVNVSEFKEHVSYRFALVPRVVDLSEVYLRPSSHQVTVEQVEPILTQPPRLRSLIIPDLHVPFTDPELVDALYRHLDGETYHKIVLIGDMLDLPEWTLRWSIDPENLQRTQRDIDMLSNILYNIRVRAPNSEIVALEGNHDLRFASMMKANLPQGFSLATKSGGSMSSLATYVNFEGLRIDYIDGYPEADYRVDENTIATHGDKIGGPGGSAPKMYRDEDNVVFGHSHRCELVYFSQGRWCFNVGFLGKNDGSLPGSRRRNNWSNALGVIETYADYSVPRLLMFNDGVFA
jgi:predicted phosphodiesterase